jgi:sec-independent protein translocase protein TatA
MFGLTIWHWVLVFVIVVLLFGRTRASSLARQLGRGFGALKRDFNEMHRPREDK